MLLTAPFYSQHWELDSWEGLGFKSRDEALYWQNSSCGVLCLKMAVEGIIGKKTKPISDIIHDGKLLGAYSHENGWLHSGLTQLAQKLGVHAFAQKHMTLQDLKKYADEGRLSIISIKWAFEPTKNLKERLLFWRKSGGHLALAVGYDVQGFRVHHTSILRAYNGEGTMIPFSKFEKAFTGRGVVVSAS